MRLPSVSQAARFDLSLPPEAAENTGAGTNLPASATLDLECFPAARLDPVRDLTGLEHFSVRWIRLTVKNAAQPRREPIPR
jgi:hypothetical protein